MPRYVILEHDHPALHWDLMLEAGAVLRTWRLAQPPGPGALVPAEAIGPHRLAYLDYEGPVSGQRGTVQRWDWGLVRWEVDEAERAIVHLDGHRLHGWVTLTRATTGVWSCVWRTGS